MPSIIFCFPFALHNNPLCCLLPGSANDPREHVDVDVLTDLGLLGLVLSVAGDLDQLALDLPAGGLGDEGLGLGIVQSQPAGEDAEVNLAVSMAHQGGDSDADELLEASHIGNQVGAEVVVVDHVPEAGVLGTLELVVQLAKVADSLGQIGTGVGCQYRGRNDVQRKRELGRREVGQGLDQDVGDDIILEAVGVELVTNELVSKDLDVKRQSADDSELEER